MDEVDLVFRVRLDFSYLTKVYNKENSMHNFLMQKFENPYIERKSELIIAREKSDRFLGCSLFWQHLDKIPMKYVYKSTTVEYRSIKLMFAESILTAIVCVVFSVMLIQSGSTRLNLAVNQQADFWSSGLTRVRDVDTLWTWIQDDLVSRMYSATGSNTDFSDAVTPPPGWLSMTSEQAKDYVHVNGLFDLSSGNPGWSPSSIGGLPFDEVVLLGPVRIRQLSVKAVTEDCGMLKSCFPSFTSGKQDKSKFMRVGTPASIASAFKWRSGDSTQQSQIEGVSGIYPPEGYVVDLGLNKTEALNKLDMLKEWSWIDESTRAVIVELSVVNSRIPGLINTIILFEINGGVLVSHSHLPIELETPVLINIATFSVFTTYLLYVLVILVKTGPIDFFSFWWNYVDVSALVLFFMSVDMTVSPSLVTPSILSPIYAPLRSVFMPFSKYLTCSIQLRLIKSSICMLLWLRMVKSLALVPLFRTAVKVFERAVVRVGIFLIPFFVILLALSIGFCLCFSTKEFESVPTSLFTLSLLWAHAIDLTSLFWSSPDVRPVATVILILYLGVVWLMLLPTVLGICLHTLREHIKETEAAWEANRRDRFAFYPPGVNTESFWHSDPVLVFLYTWWYRVRGFELIKEAEEDIGAIDEQAIDLNLLPEVIQVKWEDKRNELHNTLESRKRKLSGATRYGNRMSKLMNTISQAVSWIRGGRSSKIEAIKSDTGLYGQVHESQISRIQLQRLVDGDKDLVETLLLADDSLKRSDEGKLRALDIIRRYSTQEALSQKAIIESIFGDSDKRNRDNRYNKSVKEGLSDVMYDLELTWKFQLNGLTESVTEIGRQLVALKQSVDEINALKPVVTHHRKSIRYPSISSNR